MDFRKGNWNAGQAFNLESDMHSDLLDDKMSKNIVGDLRKNLPPGGFPKHKPVIHTTPGSKPATKATPKRNLSSTP